MVGRIKFGKNLTGILIYHKLKIDNDHTRVLGCHKLPITPTNGKVDMALLAKAFAPHLSHPRSRRSDPVFHASLNPNPKDQFTDAQLIEMAHYYMEHLGYGNQPYVIFLHEDIKRKHLHIVSSCIGPDGRTIDRYKYKERSVKVTQQMEREFNLTPTLREEEQPFEQLRKVSYTEGNIKAQISSVIRNLLDRYRFCSRGEFNTLLGQFNVSIKECKGEINGRPYEGIVYGALDDRGQRVGNPIKSSRIGKDVGYGALQKRYSQTKEWIKKNYAQLEPTRTAIREAMKSARSPEEFQTALRPKGLSVVFRRSEQAQGRIYGVTFIDHRNGLVINGSRLDKFFSANHFHDLFTQGTMPEFNPKEESKHSGQPSIHVPHADEFPDFDLLTVLLDEAAAQEQWEEWERMERKKRRHHRVK